MDNTGGLGVRTNTRKSGFEANVEPGAMILLVACWLLGGCAATGQEVEGVKVRAPERGLEAVPGLTDDRQAVLPPAPGPIEVNEEMHPDGKTVRTRVEVYRDADGKAVRHGRLINFWENGAKKSQVTYVHGVTHGPRTSWYQTGQVWIDGMNLDGGAHGTWTVWYPNGNKAQEKSFDHGGFHGAFREWHSNGRLKREYHMVRGVRQGPETVWNEKGNVIGQIEYVDNVLQP